jgi:predicted nuclease of restriction endonuclease-like (RecB) superfamily
MNKSYLQFVQDLRQNIIQSRYIAARLANREQLLLYMKVGKMLSDKVAAEKWGAKVLEQISADLQKELPGLRGFSTRNLKKMRQLYEMYSKSLIGPLVTAQLKGGTIWSSATAKSETVTDKSTLNKSEQSLIGQSATAQLKKSSTAWDQQSIEAFFGISFTHHVLLLNKCQSEEERYFYMQQAATQFWSVSLLEHHISANLYHNQGKISNNFGHALPDPLKASALQVFQDEYLLDFINTDDAADERAMESQIVANIKRVIMQLGKGFSFVANQYRLEVGEQEFFVDLLFYNRHLQCLVAFELKRGHFKPEYAGKLNFYLNVLDDKVKLPHEQPSIGIILCKEKNNTVVEYSVKTIDKAMGIATYKTTSQAPKEIKDVLPAPDELASLL